MLGAEAVRQLVGQGHHRVVHISRPYRRINIQYTRLSKKSHTAWVCNVHFKDTHVNRAIDQMSCLETSSASGFRYWCVVLTNSVEFVI
jgi:hypothetical protein